MSFQDFYIYQHRKADTNEIFYVGKGSKNRLNKSIGRNIYWKNIVNKHNFIAEIVVNNLNEELAFLIEQELIDKYKKIGIKLCNLTDGGIGGVGFVMPKETKQKLRIANLGKTLTEEHKQKISKSNKGNKSALGFKHNEEFCKKASENAKKRTYSEETRKKMSESAKKRIERFITDETKLKISNSLKAKSNV